jgi:hypothetical protein
MTPDNEFEQLALPLRRARISLFLDTGLFAAFGRPRTVPMAMSPVPASRMPAPAARG